ncbi:hypothetical protein D3C71_1791250 [compost metagenome]
MLDAEPALHALRVTGSFPAREPGRFLAALPSVLPVAVAELASGGTRISRAGKK